MGEGGTSITHRRTIAAPCAAQGVMIVQVPAGKQPGDMFTLIVPEPTVQATQPMMAVPQAQPTAVPQAQPMAVPQQQVMARPNAAVAQASAVQSQSFGRVSQPASCPQCQHTGPTVVKYEAGCCTYVACCCASGCGCCCIPFCIAAGVKWRTHQHPPAHPALLKAQGAPPCPEAQPGPLSSPGRRHTSRLGARSRCGLSHPIGMNDMKDAVHTCGKCQHALGKKGACG